jgi:hypothetical protein
MIFCRVSTISTGSAAVFDSAFAPCHGSRLFTLRLLFNHSPAVSFLTSPALGSFSGQVTDRFATDAEYDARLPPAERPQSEGTGDSPLHSIDRT